MIYVRGSGSAIARALGEMTATHGIPHNEPMPDDGEAYLFCQGLLHQKPITEQTDEEIAETFLVNTGNVIRECERLLRINPNARICVMGSESAYTGSFDQTYAAAKAGLHAYVETRRLVHHGQQLVCVAPSGVLNTGMTDARNKEGAEAFELRRRKHPKRRWLEPNEVARMIHFLLCVDQGYTTGVVIRMTGGEHCG